MSPAWPDSRRLQKTHQGIVTRAPGKCLLWASRVNRKGPEWGPGGCGSRRGGRGLRWPLPGARSPLVWSGWCTREPGGRPGEPGSAFAFGGWAVPWTAAPAPPSSFSHAPLPRARFSRRFPAPASPSSRFSYLGCRLAAGSQTGHFPPSSGQSFLLPLPPLPAREQQTNK